jgi:hypothetical protein
MQGNTPLLFDEIVLSASGVAREVLLSKVQEGDEIGVSQEISNCTGSPQVNWSKTYAATGGDYHFLIDGVITIDNSNPDAAMPNSRTAIAFNTSFVFFIVVDGWNAGVSEGISLLELGGFARETLQANDGVTLDSGGSSTIVINGQVVNNTYCNFTRNCGMQAEQNRNNQSSPAGSPAAAALEPLVGNSWLMVAVEPKVSASQFSPGKLVVIVQSTELRLGPGTNYAAITIIPAGAQGVILYKTYNDLHGVLATGAYWQPVKYRTYTGWVRQETLMGIPNPVENPLFLPVVRR